MRHDLICLIILFYVEFSHPINRFKRQNFRNNLEDIACESENKSGKASKINEIFKSFSKLYGSVLNLEQTVHWTQCK